MVKENERAEGDLKEHGVPCLGSTEAQCQEQQGVVLCVISRMLAAVRAVDEV